MPDPPTATTSGFLRPLGDGPRDEKSLMCADAGYGELKDDDPTQMMS
jgi:hypothetical protein